VSFAKGSFGASLWQRDSSEDPLVSTSSGQMYTRLAIGDAGEQLDSLGPEFRGFTARPTFRFFKDKKKIVLENSGATSHELRFSHHLSPSDLLTLPDRLYSAHPRAVLVSILGEGFGYGQSVSSSVTHAFLRRSPVFGI